MSSNTHARPGMPSSIPMAFKYRHPQTSATHGVAGGSWQTRPTHGAVPVWLCVACALTTSLKWEP